MASREAAFRRRRRSILARLARVERDLRRHDESEATQLEPPAARQRARRPLLGRRALTALRSRLLEELAAVDEEWPGHH